MRSSKKSITGIFLFSLRFVQESCEEPSSRKNGNVELTQGWITKKNSKKVVEELDLEEVHVLVEKEKKIAIFKDGRRKVHRYSAV